MSRDPEDVITKAIEDAVFEEAKKCRKRIESVLLLWKKDKVECKQKISEILKCMPWQAEKQCQEIEELLNQW